MLKLNRTTHAGNLVADPEVRYGDNQQCMAKFTIAVDESWKDKQGELVKKTEYIPVVFWGKQAEVCEKYLKKGMPLYVEGKMQTRSYDDKEGNKRYVTEVKGTHFQFLSPAPKPSEHHGEQPPASSFGGGFEDGPDGVPF